MAPDQNISMLVNVCREAVENMQKSADAWKKAIAADSPSILPDWHAKMVAVLKLFEAIP